MDNSLFFSREARNKLKGLFSGGTLVSSWSHPGGVTREVSGLEAGKIPGIHTLFEILGFIVKDNNPSQNA